MQVPHVPQSHTSSVAQLANACIALRTSLLQRREIVAEQQFFIAHVEVEPMLQVDHGHMALQAVDHPRPRDVQPLPQQVVPAAVVVQGHHGHAQRPTARVRQCQARHQQRALQAFAAPGRQHHAARQMGHQGMAGGLQAGHDPEVIGGIGGFGGLFSAAALKDMEDPILISGTDGVGTKLVLAQIMDRHETVGQDLVAMCVNDILASGAEPLFFLDYVAIGHIEAEHMAKIIKGVADGCKLAGCALVGGEMAEHPGVMAPADYDLAGFTVGVVDRPKMLDPANVRPGDVILVEEDQRSFTALGALGGQTKVPLGNEQINAIEAVAMVGGLSTLLADPKGVFVLREEPQSVAQAVLGRPYGLGNPPAPSKPTSPAAPAAA